jgi:DNA-binding XRE family transcriptional regulator
MVSRKRILFEDWEAEKLQNSEFAAAAAELEPGYQIARLRIKEGLTQAQLAEKVGTKQPSIARLENGSTQPTLSSLKKIGKALNARVVVQFVSEN